jgi:transposase
VSRYRLSPSPEQEAVLIEHCAHARYVWNLAWNLHQFGTLETYGDAYRRTDRDGNEYIHQKRRPVRPLPSYLEQARMLTEARAECTWLAAGSQNVQQQALRDFAQAMRNFYAGTHGRPGRRRRHVDEGFRITDFTFTMHVKHLNRRWGQVWVPKCGWVRFRWTRAIPECNLARRFDLIRFEDLNIKNLTRSAKGTAERPGVNVRPKAGLNRSILAQGWGLLVRRTEDKATGRVAKVRAAYTSLRCSACGWISKDSRDSQAWFCCISCGFTCNADINASINIAAGHAGGTPLSVREPQLLASLTDRV